MDWPVEDVALAAALANPWAGIVLSGAVTVQQVRRNRAVFDRSISAECLECLKPAAEPPELYLGQAAKPTVDLGQRKNSVDHMDVVLFARPLRE